MIPDIKDLRVYEWGFRNSDDENVYVVAYYYNDALSRLDMLADEYGVKSVRDFVMLDYEDIGLNCDEGDKVDLLKNRVMCW